MTLMDLVEDDGINPCQVRIAHQAAKENPGRHELNPGVAGCRRLPAHGVGGELAGAGPGECGKSACGGSGCHPSWLGDDDPTRTPRCDQRRDEGRLAGARWGDDDRPPNIQGCGDLVAMIGNRMPRAYCVEVETPRHWAVPHPWVSLSSRGSGAVASATVRFVIASVGASSSDQSVARIGIQESATRSTIIVMIMTASGSAPGSAANSSGLTH